MDIQNRHTNAQSGTQSAGTLPEVRLPTSVIGLWVPKIWKKRRDQHPTVFKHPENVPRRENFPAWQRQQQRYHTFAFLCLGRGWIHDNFL
jgi:hypothetical protein